MTAPLAPETILHDRYRLVAVAGEGSLGRTYLARDQQRSNQLCVLKEFIPNQPDAAALKALEHQFQQEVAVLHELKHPQIPSFQTLIAQGQRFYWVREYIPGKSYGVLLNERKAAGAAFSEAEVIHLLKQVLPVLTYLHSQGIVHQNLSLDSLIQRHHDQQPVLINFGLIKALVARLQLHPIQQMETIGRWGYVPPEQLFGGQVHPNGDLYALAVGAIVLLTGKYPEELYDEAAQALNWERWVTLTPKLNRILRQLLNPDPQKRFASAAHVQQALEIVTSEVETSSPAQPVATEMAPKPPPEPRLSIPTPARSARIRMRQPRLNSDFLASAAMVTGLALLVAVISWRIISSVFTDRPPQPQVSPPAEVANSPTTPAPSPTPTPAPSPSAAATPAASVNPEALRERRRKLGVDYQLFTNLVDELFYAKNPQVRDRKLSSSPEQTKLQAEWNEVASTLMDKLETLTPQTRGKLGTYRRRDYDQWLKALGETGPTSQTLDNLADARLFELFPDLKGKTLNPRTFGQVWYAIAEESVDQAKAQKSPGGAPPNSNGPSRTGDRQL